MMQLLTKLLGDLVVMDRMIDEGVHSSSAICARLGICKSTFEKRIQMMRSRFNAPIRYTQKGDRYYYAQEFNLLKRIEETYYP